MANSSVTHKNITAFWSLGTLDGTVLEGHFKQQNHHQKAQICGKYNIR